MKRWVHAKEDVAELLKEVEIPDVEVEPSGKYEIVDSVSIAILIDVFDDDVTGSTGTDSYPGPQQFLIDAEQVIQNKGNTILWSENSNRPDSPSIYIIYECPLSDDKALFCTIFIKITNHQNMISDFTQDTQDFRREKSKSYARPGSLWIDYFDFVVQMEVRRGYQEALDKIGVEIDDIKRSELMQLKRQGG